MVQDTGGVYEVKESGLEFRHEPQNLPTPKNGREFVERFRNKFDLRVLDRPSKDELVFELVGVDASFANALRRILLSDIPTVAIEDVYMFNNTSIVHDEVLAHRLGLIPINVDARLFDFKHDGEATDRDTVVFRLAVGCSKKDAPAKKAAPEATAAQDSSACHSELEAAAAEAVRGLGQRIETPSRPYTKHVYSGDLEWFPQGGQAEKFPDGIRPVVDDILLAKLRPGQEIELEAHACVGTGRDHAKFSPVATACYRLMPRIEIVKPIYDALAEELVHLYEPGVFELVPASRKEDPPSAKVRAKLCNPYACTMSRNFMRNAELNESIKMSRVPNHFIFSVESVGMQSPAVLVAEALHILQSKCENVISLADASAVESQYP